MKYIIIYSNQTGKCTILTSKYETVKTYYNVANLNNIINKYNNQIEYVEYQ